MSTTETRLLLEEARVLAEQLVALIGLSCRHVEIAGSIRRGAPTIGDIDLVCEPLTTPLVDMFGEPTGEVVDHLHDRLCDLERLGTIDKRRDKRGLPAWGMSLKRAVYRGLGVDVQAVRDPSTWGAWMVIRTGPALLNKAIVTPRHQGGLLAPGLEIRDGFRVYRSGGQIPTPTEEDFFRALGFEYQRPQDRGVLPLAPEPRAVAEAAP